MNFWNQQFAAHGYKYGTQPNAFLVAQAHRLMPGSDVLVPGDGEGRNGVWLAQQGHRVTSMDASAVGLAKARDLASSRGVHLQTVEADLADWTPASDSADAVVLTFVHLSPAIRLATHRRLMQALRPGGLVLVEAFHPRQLPLRSGGPKDETMLYTLAMLRQDFDGLEECLAEEVEALLDEGPGHQGPAQVVRWIGRRVG
jgi:trans-aconitate methyltransferase